MFSREIVQRYRGGKNFEPVYETWSPNGLIRRGRLAYTKPTENGGRELLWSDYPPSWASRQPDHGPYVLRAVAELALRGADVSGCNIPGAAELAACNLNANRLANNDVESIGLRLDEPADRFDPLLTSHSGPQVLYRLELEDARHKKDAARNRVRTSEYRNEQTGEYGRESRMTHDGRVFLGKRDLPLLSRSPSIQPRLKGYTTRRDVTLTDGRTKRVEAQKSPTKRKPGPKPQNGFTMNPRLRKIKQRCKEKGIPFVIEDHLNAASGLSPPANSRADTAPPSVPAHSFSEDENDTNRASRDGG